MKKCIVLISSFIGILNAAELNQTPNSSNFKGEGEEINTNFETWRATTRGTTDVEVSYKDANGLTLRSETRQLKYEIRQFPKQFPLLTWIGDLSPTCSILMSNGAQIDFIPGKAVFWICRDYSVSELKGIYLFTGKINGNNLYDLSTQKIGSAIMKSGGINLAEPSYITYAQNSSFPMEHPLEIRESILKKWFER